MLIAEAGIAGLIAEIRWLQFCVCGIGFAIVLTLVRIHWQISRK